NMRRAAERLVRYLEANGFHAAAITGDVDQRRRLHIMADFKEGRLPILVATDVASRGLHIEGVTHVFNYDLPFDAEDYVHRVGRPASTGGHTRGRIIRRPRRAASARAGGAGAAGAAGRPGPRSVTETSVHGSGGTVSASIRRRWTRVRERPTRAAPHRRSDGAAAPVLRRAGPRAPPAGGPRAS